MTNWIGTIKKAFLVKASSSALGQPLRAMRKHENRCCCAANKEEGRRRHEKNHGYIE